MEQVANLWLIIIGGSVFNQLDPFIERPASIVDLLGESVPGKAQVGGLAGGPLDICCVCYILCRCVGGSSRG